MGKKKQTYQKKSFESTGAPSDTSANIYMSMLMSPAWNELTAKQRVLYLYCKLQYYGEKAKSNPYKESNPLTFTMNQSKWRDLYGLYKRNDEKSFYRDITALIEKGFIACVVCGWNERKKTVYAFSSKWQMYGKEGFEILPSEKTCHMLRKEKSY